MLDDNVRVVPADNITERQRELLVKYWTREDDGRFTFGVQELAAEWSESTTNLLQLVRAAGTAYLQHSRCQQCEGIIYVDCRSSMTKHLLHPSRPCDVCRYGLEDAIDEIDSALAADTVQPALSAISADTSGCSDTQGEDELTELDADYIISLNAFARDPGSIMAAFKGSRLAVLDGNKPVFYCLPPTIRTDNKQVKSASDR